MATPSRELLAYERHQPAVARPETPTVVPARRRRPWLIAGAAVGAVLFLAIGATAGVVARNRAVNDQRARAVGAEQQVASLRDQLSRQQSRITEQQRQLANEKAQVEQLKRTPPSQPKPEPTPAVNAATSFGDGLYQVGIAIQPGQYRTDGTGTCYWGKLSTGNTNDVIVNNYSSGPQTVTIDSPYFESESCGTWTKVG
jgi:type II secretory pathway pseudopilin PulG